MVAVVGGGQLGQRHWHDLTLAHERIAGALRLSGSTTAEAAASLVMLGVAVTAVAFAVPIAASAIGVLASGAWPWWMTPLGRLLTSWRERRWERLGQESVRARGAGNDLRADHFDARRARTAPVRPGSPTWSGDRFRAAEAGVRRVTGADVANEWTKLLLTTPDTSRSALTEVRDAYDAACEALAWSVAFTFLGAWWWPAAVAGIVLWLTSCRALRRAVETLCRTTEAVFALQHAERQVQPGTCPCAAPLRPSPPPPAQ
ncbi:hypothetical protein AB0I02_02170 [Streptomyces phaeochromogenes]